MDTKQINDALDRIFNEEGVRVVFWNDPEREFLSALPFLMLDNVNLIRLDDAGALETKIRIELDDPSGRYLLYSPTEEPDEKDDWLLDIRLYGRGFRADRATILLNELELRNQALRQHLTDRRKFFDNKERLQKLKALVAPDDIAADLDRKMIAVVAKADQPELFIILRTLYHAYTESAVAIDLDAAPAVWEAVEKFDLAPPFWSMVKTAFGYAAENPSLKNLLIRLLVTDYAHDLAGPVPGTLANLVLPPSNQSNAIVCLAQWRDNASKGSSYDRLSEKVGDLIHIDDHLHGREINDLIDVMTFMAVEQTIASRLRERVQSTADTIDATEIRAIAARRQAGHWASTSVTGAAEVPRQALHAVYDALVAAAEFFVLRNQHQSGFGFPDAAALYRAYESDIFRFDQLYRHFCEAADQAEAQGWNLLKPLREPLEACYANWYVPTLALAWGKFVDPQGTAALLAKWQIEGVPNEQGFFARHVRPRVDEAENRRAWVVISDAFRYEAAHELVQELNGKYRFEASLSSQLGVLPSYTALGMASLLPHTTLTYKPNGAVLVDGKPTTSTEQRNEILKSVGGIACKADDLAAMKRDEGREFVKDSRVVYVYHNVVDVVGEQAASEARTFEAVRKAIDELAALVGYIINKLNGSHVVVTADHGFLFTESAPGDPEKSKLSLEPEGTVRAKKRYLIGHRLPDHEATWHGSTRATAGAEGEMEFWIPRGANRFHFAGGARFVHGGAMLQEIVVPVVTVREVEGKSTIRERGSLKLIDKVTVTLNEKRDVYEALLGNLGVKGIAVESSYVKKYEKLLVGGIWCIVTLEYFYEESQKGSPFVLRDLKPIQMPNLDLDELFAGRRAFTEEQWIDVLLRSTGMEPVNFTERVKWHLLARMVPLVENNVNLCELGPRGTGKSHIYKEISPNSILISGGQTTVANLFYNMAKRTVGLVGVWDVVAFDEVAGISFKDKDGVQIMKDYMASGSFARGRDAVNAYASMVFVGNINQPVDTLVKTSHLLAPFPETMIDSAFFDRFHAYIPGWEIPKMRPEFFTNQFGLIVDYLADEQREGHPHNSRRAVRQIPNELLRRSHRRRIQGAGSAMSRLNPRLLFMPALAPGPPIKVPRIGDGGGGRRRAQYDDDQAIAAALAG